jgi:photosystem II stability/assembly factor-like uncharacterized protein
MKKSLLYIISNFILLSSFQIYSQTITWSETQPAGAVNYNWSTTSMSSDGQTIIAGIHSSTGRLYISHNGGTSWIETNPHTPYAGYWFTSSMSSDGQTIIAGEDGGRLYLTTNGGTNWSETQPAGNVNKSWNDASMSSNGQRIIIAGSLRLYLTTDGGLHWSETQPAGNVNKSWTTTSMSSDGLTIIAGESVGRLYITTNGGINWNETKPKGDVSDSWETTSMSSNGQIIIAGVYGGRLYLSTNGGTSWNETQPAGNSNFHWETTSMSSDGTIIIAGATLSERIYITANGGSSWTETQPVGNIGRSWVTSSMSSDGTKAIVGYDDVGGRLYINNEPLPVEITSIAASVSNNKVLLNWQTATEVNNYGFEIERSVAQISNLFNNWEKIGFVQGHGNSNSPKDYSFVDANPPSGKLQYRLKQIDTDGSFEYSQVVQVETELPKQFSLEQNYPNPFNPSTTIKYSIPSVMVSLPDEVRLSNHDNADVIPSLSNKYNSDVIPSLSRDEVHVTLKIYDLLGREVATLVDEYQKPGTYNYQLSTSNYQLSSGVYFYQLQAGNFIATKKLILLK